MDNPKINIEINPKQFEKTVKKIKITDYLQDFPRPQFFDQAGSAELTTPAPIVSAKEKSSLRPFNVILPISNSFINSNGKVLKPSVFNEKAAGLGFSTLLSENTGAFAIVTSNLNGALTSVAGVGYVPMHKEMGDFQLNLGVSAEVVCVEHGDRSKITPNPRIGTCGLFGSVYSSLLHIPSGFGGQLITTPAVGENQDTVLSTAIFKKF